MGWDKETLERLVYEQKLDVLVVSFGGCCSNALVDVLEKNGFKCRSAIWKKILCHSPMFLDLEIPTIYIYGDPIESYMSMKRRGDGFWLANQKKMSNGRIKRGNGGNLLDLMRTQFDIFTSQSSKKVLVVDKNSLFSNEQGLKTLLHGFLGSEVKFLPVSKRERMSKAEDLLTETDYAFFKEPKHSRFISKVQNYVPASKLPVSVPCLTTES
jgi:hypothetical protein